MDAEQIAEALNLFRRPTRLIDDEPEGVSNLSVRDRTALNYVSSALSHIGILVIFGLKMISHSEPVG
ncbi:hypothetical protein AB0M44_12595 [Streptosporangium subroseum]|uniref:hypothetical protein n=1 Tax=Streptosporangium subroseum TaxID=106412 RepID=UPI00342DCA66